MGVLVRLGAECRQARQRAGLNAIDIAEAAGVSEATISRLETGRRWVSEVEQIVAAYERECRLEEGELWRRATR